MRIITVAFLSAAVAQSAFAVQIVSFEASPISPTTPEFSFNGAFNEAPGAIGNGDGLAPIPAQFSPGLVVNTPFSIPGVPGSILNADGSTTFGDASLELDGLNAVGPAGILFGVIVGQSIGSGSFKILSTDTPAPGDDRVLLLEGTIADAAIGGFVGGSTASFQSLTVTYTGGLIFNQLAAANLAPLGGSLSFALIDVTPGLNVSRSLLLPFSANGSGLFSAPVVPEPSALGLLAISSLATLARRRTK